AKVGRPARAAGDTSVRSTPTGRAGQKGTTAPPYLLREKGAEQFRAGWNSRTLPRMITLESGRRRGDCESVGIETGGIAEAIVFARYQLMALSRAPSSASVRRWV